MAELEDKLKIDVIGLSSQCPKRCGHCCINAQPKGHQLGSDEIEKVVSSGLKLDNELSITDGDPLYYSCKGENISTATSILSQGGVNKIYLITSGFRPGQRIPLKALEMLAQSGVRISMGVSFSLFQPVERETYLKNMLFSVTRIIECGIPIYGIKVAYSIENELETKRQSEPFADFVRAEKERYLSRRELGCLTADWSLLMVNAFQISRVGRAVYATKYDRPPSEECSVIQNDANLYMQSNGDLTLCSSTYSTFIKPVGNVFSHSKAELEERHSRYLTQLKAHLRRKPPGMDTCLWHATAFNPNLEKSTVRRLFGLRN
jgi:hypothetical protein